MCGICGIVDFLGSPIDAGLVLRMRDVMACRGPDDVGLYEAPGVALGHRRLSIIDLSPAGHQPMGNEDGTVQIVFNGEIYNFMELRRDLEGGHRFRSRTDTEVLLHGYEQWGLEAMVRRLRGMFAFAIWDGRRRELHLVRDHLGKKPLFYRVTHGRVEFSSDIKSLWTISPQTPALDDRAIDEFLYYSVIGQNRTILRGVRKLPPASFATFRAGHFSDPASAIPECQIVKYWSPDYTRKETKSVDEWLEGIDHHLRVAVKRRLISDVPMGAFLSGGVDSSTVCALMAQEGSSRPRTFSVVFKGYERFDEGEYSRQVAQHIGSEHTELNVAPDVAPILADLVWQWGEPYGDSSMIATYLVAREARKFVTVALTGDGGDEAFAGYSRHLRADRARRFRWLTPLITQAAAPAAARLVSLLAPRTIFARNFDLAAKYLSGSRQALAGDTCWFDGPRNALYTDSFRARLAGFDPLADQRELLASLGGKSHVDRALEFLLRTTLPNDYLAKVDVATMAHSLEARSPFLDVDLLDFAATIPSALLIEGNLAKSLLKKYAATLVPSRVVYRKKHGFSVPIRHWLAGPWQKGVRELLLSKEATGRGYFNSAFIRKVLDEHAAGRRNHASRIWTLMVFEIWNRLFVDRRGIADCGFMIAD